MSRSLFGAGGFASKRSLRRPPSLIVDEDLEDNVSDIPSSEPAVSERKDIAGFRSHLAALSLDSSMDTTCDLYGVTPVQGNSSSQQAGAPVAPLAALQEQATQAATGTDSTPVSLQSTLLPQAMQASFIVTNDDVYRDRDVAIGRGGIVRVRQADAAAPTKDAAESTCDTQRTNDQEETEVSSLVTCIAPAGTERAQMIDVDGLLWMRPIGRGNSSSVRKALDPVSMTIVALKRMSVFDKPQRHQMNQELRAYAQCDSHFVAGFHGAYFRDGQVVLMLEYMDRGSLEDFVQRHGALSEPQLRAVAFQLVSGLCYLHRTLRQMHRDIKPGNVLIDRDGRVKIADFGICRRLETSSAEANTYVGTSSYMSPERIRGQSYTMSSDVWSLGLTLLFAATGQSAYPTNVGFFGLAANIMSQPSPRLTKPGFSDEAVDFIDKCLIKDGTQRWTPTQLAQHPFLQDADLDLLRALLRPKDAAAEAKLSREIDDAVVAVAQQFYINQDRQYRNSLFDRSCLNRLADAIGTDVPRVKTAFLSAYQEALQHKEAAS